MGVRKRVSALLLAVLLSFGVCAVDYLKVDALEVGGSVVWDTAINYLLGLLGLSPIAENGDKIVDFDSMRSKWVQDYEAYFYANVKPEDLPDGYTKERAYQNWIDNVCRGNLNTVEYGAWDIFREWAETLASESSSGGSGGSVSYSVSDAIHSYLPDVNLSGLSENILNFNYSNIMYYDPSGGYKTFYFFESGFTFTWSGTSRLTYSSSTPLNLCTITISGGRVYSSGISKTSGTWIGFGSALFYNIDYPSENTNLGEFVFDGVSIPVSSEYEAVNDKITDLQIINDYSTTTTQNVVSIDWDRIGAMISDAVGTVTGSLDRTITDALDDAQEKVSAGTMSVANYNDYVTEISNTYVYDITNETSITNPDSTVTGVISGNVENAEFVLNGLQYVFPFCIPWDIKDFVTLLVADPVAPVIEYPIYNPVTDTDEIITIDFSLWENQVRIIRYIFDFLLIIGLLLLARSLIGAGGSD